MLHCSGVVFHVQYVGIDWNVHWSGLYKSKIKINLQRLHRQTDASWSILGCAGSAVCLPHLDWPLAEQTIPLHYCPWMNQHCEKTHQFTFVCLCGIIVVLIKCVNLFWRTAVDHLSSSILSLLYEFKMSTNVNMQPTALITITTTRQMIMIVRSNPGSSNPTDPGAGLTCVMSCYVRREHRPASSHLLRKKFVVNNNIEMLRCQMLRMLMQTAKQTI